MNRFIVVAGAVCGMTVAPAAFAQEGLATSGTLGGHNTIQQAPSGGRVGAGTGDILPPAEQGRPTAADKQMEERNNAATQICKGC